MAKKQVRSSPNHSTVKKTSKVASPAKKPLEVATISKKPLVVSSPSKKPTEVASTSKMPVEEVASTSKKPLVISPPAKKLTEEVASTSKRRKQPVINPPPESLTDDKEMGTEEGEEDEDDASSEEENKLKKPVKTPSATAPVVAATVVQSSSSESGSETESGETDSETEPPPPPPPPADEASPRLLRKRPSEQTASTDVNASKRAKTETEETENTAKKALFQRVWSENDEVALLQGMFRLKNKTGKIPCDDFAASYEMVKGSSYLKEKSCSQFSNKVSNLRDTYLKRKMIRTKAHDMKCLNLCKKIWGNDLVVVKSKKKMIVENDESDGESDWFERANLVGDLTGFGVVDEVAVKRKWGLVSLELKKKLEEQWKDLEDRNFERLMNWSVFVYEVSSAINNAN